jgi:hypothetical protein
MMFRVITLLLATIFCYRPLGLAADAPLVATAKPQEGVFVGRDPSFIYVLELKDGRYRQWIWPHIIGKAEVGPPRSGKYVFDGDTVTLKALGKSNRVLTFRTVNGEIQLWEPTAIDFYARERRLNEWGKGIYRITTKTPEEMGYRP